LDSRHNVATTLAAQGKHIEAEKEYRSVIAVRERVLGPEHARTLVSRNDLANALFAEGKHAEAQKEYRAVLAIQERVSGAKNPNVSQSCYNLALALEAQGKTREALEFAKRAEDACRAFLESDHPRFKDAKALREEVEAKLKEKEAEDRRK